MRGEESSDSESGRMEESSVRSSLDALCQELNMDAHTAAETMDTFTAIWNTYTLEVRGAAAAQRRRVITPRYHATRSLTRPERNAARGHSTWGLKGVVTV